jgi:Amt family ammonium transporter
VPLNNAHEYSSLRRIPAQIALPAVLALLLFVGAVFFVVIPDLEHNARQFERQKLQELGDAACGMLAHFENEAQAGRLSQEQARREALAMLRGLRYGTDGKDYFWISDLKGVLLMHPHHPQLEGRIAAENMDEGAKRILSETASLVTAQGRGFIEYRWQGRDDPSRIASKMAYVRLFEPWGWALGAGEHQDEARLRVTQSRNKLLLVAAAIFAAVTLPVVLIILRALISERKREQTYAALQTREAQHRALVDNIALGVAMLDREGRILAANATLQAWFPEAAPGGGVWRELLEARSLAPLGPSSSVQDALASGQVRERTLRLRVAEQERIFHSIASPVREADDAISSIIVMLDDVTERYAAQEALNKAHEAYRSIFDNAVEGIFQTTPEGRYIRINPTLARIYGYGSVEECMASIQDISRQLYVKASRRDDFIRMMNADGEVWDFESQVFRKDGDTIWISENARLVRDEDGKPLYYEGRVVDISQRKEAEAALREKQVYFRQLFVNSPQAIALIDANGKIVDVNKGYELLFGQEASEVKGKYNRFIVTPEELMHEAESFYKAVTSGLAISKETIRKHKDGRRIPVSMHGYPVDIDGEVHGIFYVYTDISERKAFEEQLSHQAFHDPLTGLPNRALFIERLSRAVKRANRRDDYHFAILLLDLDKFKKINDTLGHQIGDELLVAIGRRIQPYLRSVDTLARLGGDEFAIILEEFGAPREVIHVANRIQALMQQPFILKGKQVFTACSIGIVLDTKGYKDPEDLLRDADIAMYRSKEQHRGRMVFNRKMHDQIVHNVTLENELRLAIANNELELYYQPIVSVASNHIEGFEALARWVHPTRGLLSPNRFIPIAEESGLIVPLGQWVLRQALGQLKSWLAVVGEESGLTMHVNLSPKQFLQNDLVEFVRQTLKEFGVPAHLLKLEITENVIMHDAELAVEKLTRLRKIGVTIAIDDFGTGYSSLSYLQRFPIDCLKIDRSFISGEDAGEKNEIVRAIVSLAQNLGLGVVAEGVETESQLSLLRDMNCNNAQGFMFSRPVRKDEAEVILKSHFP